MIINLTSDIKWKYFKWLVSGDCTIKMNLNRKYVLENSSTIAEDSIEIVKGASCINFMEDLSD